jgi:amino acid transporter
MIVDVTDAIYLIANGLVVVAYLIIANTWFRLRDQTWRSPQPPSLRLMLALMITLDAVTFLLDAASRFSSVFVRANALAHVALAVVAAVTAYTVAKRGRMLRDSPA